MDRVGLLSMIAILASLPACRSRAEEEARCRYLVRPMYVGECLVERYDWDPSEANRAALRALRNAQARADSIAQERESP